MKEHCSVNGPPEREDIVFVITALKSSIIYTLAPVNGLGSLLERWSVMLYSEDTEDETRDARGYRISHV